MKTFIPLGTVARAKLEARENNPAVQNPLAYALGMSSALAYHDVYSLFDDSLLALVPRPSHALLFVYPHTPAIDAYADQRTAAQPRYTGSGSSEPVFFVPQTIVNACGLMALMHSLCNGVPAEQYLEPRSTLHQFLTDAVALGPEQRAELLEASEPIEEFFSRAALEGDSVAPALGVSPGHSFIAYVKGRDGHMWEMGGRKGPIDLGILGSGEDMLSEAALAMGPKTWLQREQLSGEDVFRFSCVSLGPKE